MIHKRLERSNLPVKPTAQPDCGKIRVIARRGLPGVR
jgi:hypothetical protein